MPSFRRTIEAFFIRDSAEEGAVLLSMRSPELYKRLKIAGLALYIPATLVAGPLGGYFVGEFLARQLHRGLYFSLLFAAVGFVASVAEVVRIIRYIIAIDRHT